MASVAVARGRLPATSVGAVALQNPACRHPSPRPGRSNSSPTVGFRSRPATRARWLQAIRTPCPSTSTWAVYRPRWTSIADRSRRSGLQPAASSEAALVRLPKGAPVVGQARSPGHRVRPACPEVRWLEDLQQVDFRLQALPHCRPRGTRRRRGIRWPAAGRAGAAIDPRTWRQ